MLYRNRELVTISIDQKQLAIGADHAGYELKEKLKQYLLDQGYEVKDCGTFSKESVDYPAIALNVAKLISRGEYNRGIIIDGAGIGSAMVANKLTGVRAALCYDVSSAKNSCEHNDANVLTLGAGFTGFELAKQIADVWLQTECTVDRHQRRVKMIEEIETKGKISESEYHTELQNLTTELSTSDMDRIATQISTLYAEKFSTATQLLAICDNETCNSCGQCADKAPEAVRQFLNLGAARVSNAPGGKKTPKDIAKYIDHTLLKPEASSEDIIKLCQEALENEFAAVCINPSFVKLAYNVVKDSTVKVCTVVGFPLGANVSEIKGMEARRAIREGAKEIDMVINVGALKSKDENLVFRDIRAVVEACVDGSAICKVIIEAALLTDEEKVLACELAKKARAHYVKTSTGFGPGGATAHDVALMSKVVKGSAMGIKAAGGIRSLEEAEKMIKAGATRIGASAGVKILQQAAELTESA